MFEWTDSMPDFLRGAIFGAVFAFMPTFFWDLRKRYLDRKDRLTAAIGVLRTSLRDSSARIQMNRQILDYEKSITGAFNDVALLPIDADKAWLMVSGAAIESIAKDQELLSLLVTVCSRVAHLNQNIRAREEFRVSQRAVSSYVVTIRKYGELISSVIDQIDPLLTDLDQKLSRSA